MIRIYALLIIACVLIVTSCQKDNIANNKPSLSLQLLQGSDSQDCVFVVYTHTKEQRGLRPVNFDNLQSVPRVLQHRLVPISEEWETEVCYTSDGKRALRKVRVGDVSIANNTALAYKKSGIDEVKIDQNGNVESYSEGVLVETDAFGPRSDTATYDMLREYRRLPKDSFLLAMGYLRDSIAASDDYNDLTIEVHEDYVSILCNSGNFYGSQIIDAELQLPRMTVISEGAPGEYTKILTKARSSESNEFPVLEKVSSKRYLNPTRTAGVPMYMFENKEFISFEISSID